MDAPENSDGFSLDEIRALELERAREEAESELRQREAELRQREAEQRAQDEERERQRRARAIEDERRAQDEETQPRVEAELKPPPARSEAPDHGIPSLKPRFPIALVVAGTLLVVGTGLAALLPQRQDCNRAVPPPSPGISAQLAAQRSALQLERAAERVSLEARIRALQEELEAARQQVASASAALSTERERHAHRPAKVEVEAPAPAAPVPPQQPTAISTSKIDTSVTDPLGGLGLE